MRKIIITFIATIVLIATFEKAKGQRTTQAVATSANFPTVNVLTGVNAKISFGIWRFEPFIQYRVHLQMLEERITIETMTIESWGGVEHSTVTHYSSRFDNGSILNFGMRFRITDNDRVKIGHKSSGHNSFSRLGSQFWMESYLGYIRKINLSQRKSLELSASHALNWRPLIPDRGLYKRSNGHVNFSGYRFEYLFVSIFGRLNYEIARNLNLNVQLSYTRRYRVRDEIVAHVGGWTMENISGERFITRNIIDFSVGIHYHFGGQQQQAQQRPPRKRVAPHQRALPCPPGQMRRNRSWDRPSSVFNHPSAR